MAQIDYYFATLSPYTYLAGTRMEEVAAKHGATINYKPMDIIALVRPDGWHAAERSPSVTAGHAATRDASPIQKAGPADEP